jgi:hypothetical protein
MIALRHVACSVKKLRRINVLNEAITRCARTLKHARIRMNSIEAQSTQSDAVEIR